MHSFLPDTNPQEGWRATLDLVFEPRNQRTVLTRNRHDGPLRVQRLLYLEGKGCHAYILHPPGGVVGGDRLTIRARVKTGAAVLSTTPGATKFYRSGGREAVQKNRLRVENGACLEWLPQETIAYPGTEAIISTRVDLEKESGFVGWDVLCIGLPACGRNFDSGFLDSSFEIHREGRPLFIDRFRISDPADLHRPAGLRGFSVCGTFFAVGAVLDVADSLRKTLEPEPGRFVGLTSMDDLLVARYLGDSSFEAKQLFECLWTLLRPRLFGRKACPPGIWAT